MRPNNIISDPGDEQGAIFDYYDEHPSSAKRTFSDSTEDEDE